VAGDSARVGAYRTQLNNTRSPPPHPPSPITTHPTPQNSLPELWSLLNFILPKVFASVDNFEQWFSKPFASFRSRGGAGGSGGVGEDDVSGSLTREEQMLVIARLHQVLRPFLLRRLKSQVLSQLPEKTERVIRCGLSAWQRAYYQQIQRYGAIAVPGGGMKGLSNLIMQLRKVSSS
jgi:ATP-dependent helicase STH1/SNF2